MKVKVFDRDGRLVGPVEVPKVIKTDEEWATRLTPEQFRVARGKGTERPFCGTLLDNKRPGVYSCVSCGLPLFASRMCEPPPASGGRETDSVRACVRLLRSIASSLSHSLSTTHRSRATTTWVAS